MAKKFKKILAVLFTICVSACVLAFVSACNNNGGTTNPPALQAPSENGGGGGGMGGGPGGGPKQGEHVDADAVPEVAAGDVHTLNGPSAESISITFDNTCKIVWEDAPAGSYLLKIGGDTVAQNDPMRSVTFYYSMGGEDDWEKNTADDHGPVSLGVNPTETCTITIVIEAPAGETITCTGVAFSQNGGQH